MPVELGVRCCSAQNKKGQRYHYHEERLRLLADELAGLTFALLLTLMLMLGDVNSRGCIHAARVSSKLISWKCGSLMALRPT